MGVSNEKELITKCINGNSAAQRQFYEKYSKMMFGICLRYSNTYDEAKDILQDGFVKVYTKMGQFSYQGSFEGWMKRIFVNTALEYYRVNKNHMYHADTDEAINTPYHDFVVERISRNEIMEVINKLSPGYKMVLNLYIIEGYSHQEIAEMMGISEGTSKSQLSRARAIVQAELNKLNKKTTGNE